VFRELYSEKRVIDEERRLRVDGSPLGRWEQEFASRALPNNYRRSVIGSQEDFDRLGRREVRSRDTFEAPAHDGGGAHSQWLHLRACKHTHPTPTHQINKQTSNSLVDYG
jgi:hypothetical protein